MSAVDEPSWPIYRQSNDTRSDCTDERPAGGASLRESHIEVAVSRRRLLLAAAFQRHRIVQVALVAVILSFLVTTVPGVRAYQGYSWWMDGILQNLAYGAAAALCLVRTPTASPDPDGDTEGQGRQRRTPSVLIHNRPPATAYTTSGSPRSTSRASTASPGSPSLASTQDMPESSLTWKPLDPAK